MKKHYRHENDCLNCGAELHGHFCHVCGQENLQIKENFGHLMSHAIADYFHFDEKFFHTMKPLLFQPGKLTVDYMAGKRTQYLHPIRIYIFISLIFFLLYFSNDGKVEKKSVTVRPFNKEHFLDSLSKAVGKDGLDLGITHITKEQLKSGLVDVKVSADGRDTNITIGPPSLKRLSEIGSSAKDTSYEQYLQSQQKLAPAERDGFISRYFEKKNLEWKSKGLTPREAVSESFKHNFPKLMFFLVPLFAVLLRLVFWKNHKFYVEHLIYAFHLHCFFFLFLTLVMLIKMALPVSWSAVGGWVSFLATIGVIWYVYRSLRVLYHRSRWRTVSKMIGLSFMYMITFSVCVSIFLVIVAAFG